MLLATGDSPVKVARPRRGENEGIHEPLADRIAGGASRHLWGGDFPALVDSLDLPRPTWMNYESGVMMPASVLLRFIILTAVEPHWLWRARVPKYGPRWSEAAPCTPPS